MAINQDVRRSRAMTRDSCRQNRIAFGWVQFDIQPERAKMAREPVRTRQKIATMGGLSGNAGETNELFQLLNGLPTGL